MKNTQNEVSGTKKKKKFNWFSFIGALMIIGGLGVMLYDVGSSYLEREALKRELQDFMNAPLLDDGEAPVKQETAPWGSIEIEKLDMNHLIVKTDDWSYLQRYVVAWPNSKEPSMDSQGNFSIAGHNGRCASCVFRDFDKIKAGDIIKLHKKEDNTTYIYKVTVDSFIVPYTDTSVLNETDGKSMLTLVTCKEQNDYGTDRTIVKAELIGTEPTK